MKERRVRALRGILLDRTEPVQALEKDDVCTVEEVVENWIILRRENGTSCLVDRYDFERGFEAAEELPGVISGS